MAVEQVVYNQAVALATILGTTAGAAHQCIYSLFRLCCTLGDVTSATAQAFLPSFYKTDAATGKLAFDAAAARGTMTRIVSMTLVVALVNTLICFSVPLLSPGLLTADASVWRLMRRAAPIAAAGLLMHPSVVGMEGCLLATKDIKWLLVNYGAIGVLSVGATQALLRLPLLRGRLGLQVIWVYMAAFQAIRFVAFGWRLLTSTLARPSTAGAR